jgi:hypothetical protein
MRFPYSLIVIAPTALLTTARAAAQNVCRKGALTLPNQLIEFANPGGATTHSGFKLPLTEQMKTDFDAVKGGLNNINWFLIDSSSNLLLEAASKINNAPIGENIDISSSAELLGLTRI